MGQCGAGRLKEAGGSVAGLTIRGRCMMFISQPDRTWPRLRDVRWVVVLMKIVLVASSMVFDGCDEPVGSNPPAQMRLDEEGVIVFIDDSVDPNVQNGAAFDEARLDVSNCTHLIVPSNAAVERNGASGAVIVKIRRIVRFYGHPPKPINLEVARASMGCVWKREGSTIHLATFGEWDSRIKGSSVIELHLVVPNDLIIAIGTTFSGDRSVAATPTTYDDEEPDHWYAGRKPAPGWTRLSDSPDLERARAAAGRH